ncbi:MAG: DUF3597 domain-containing protein [Erythrobacter sp.]|jgi:hypothetical protein|nr:DUF3597 domain-containing protein [Erythrobacter sp.]RZV34271.1 MAG: DUF3597 domain-containing protein [Sphingomonadaceae bacterium]
MGIFSSIKNAIFGKDEDDKKAATRTANPGASVPRAAPVDVEERLSSKPGADKLNWRTSIVDLFKLIGLDPSYANRKELAQELGRTDYEGSAEDNIWLHKATMLELQKNGGKVPASMTD